MKENYKTIEQTYRIVVKDLI